ncbi:hypothetical protein [Burkholderia sp. JP2-270]|uniref:hypothetical protein n=1 Tax=Burkholderia sp. JP2-270 TaxID=2217913 RepID=UPI0013A6ABB1|nr:hypothetical protein [Burkholderia sp. JP2-270]
MKKLSVKKALFFLIWMALGVWVVSRTPTISTAKGKLEIMTADLSYLFDNATILSRHENAKTGAALALYDVDASTFGEEKENFLKNSLKKKGWVFLGRDGDAYVMCKSGMKASFAERSDKTELDSMGKRIFSVSMEFNAGTEDFCRRRMH